MADPRVAELRRLYPWIAWDEPIRIRVTNHGESLAYGLCCRICIALHGLKAGEVEKHPQTPIEFAAHMAQHRAPEAA
jgi:hypothetical protein